MSPIVLNIALDVPLNRTFDYLSGNFVARVGSRVVVSFAGRNLVGVVVGIAQTSDYPIEKLKSVSHIFDDVVFDGQTFKLLQFCANYYHYPLGQALMSALPLRLRQIKPAVSRKQFAYRLIDQADTSQIPARKVLMHRIITLLRSQQSVTEAELSLVSTGWRKAITELEQLNVVSAQEVLAIKASMPTSAVEPQLNVEQENAINCVLALTHNFKPWLLFGITGSGKTEVYIQVLQQILNQRNAQGNGAQVLVLVPEINLTPQLEARFRSRLSQFPLVTLHSNLSESERLQNWLAASSGTAKIVIGTRLSVFTPMPHLKMIVMDEEHDGSYKQQDGMRYHARDIAMVRAKQLNVPIILGSATPSLETWFNATSAPAETHKSAQKQQYGLLSLTQRAVENAVLPNIFCIDIAKSPTENGLSPLLIKALRERLDKGEQSLLFINRRGYAPVLHCNACQWVAPCTRCSARLVVHLSQKRLKCHHCGHEQKIPLQCPSCGNADMRPIGQATQRLEQTLQTLLPTARIARVDRDSMRNKNALTDLLTQVHNQEIDILVGTQMLAKGHDFPNLTLVGVIDTDSALYSPDFRAGERLFAQLMQVAGRAGRAEKAGEVLIQTAFPQHALFNALRAQDYVSYANECLQERQIMQFPPISFFALLRAEANDYAQVQQFLNKAINAAQLLKNDVMIYDPIRPQMERLKGMERAQLLLQANSRVALQRLLKMWMPQISALPLAAKIRWSLDIDPLEF
ncbi:MULTISPECIES: primosomal protein N' [Methylotenera]|uniref:primosomal protein N' n=1 Tax=Methylotenera TaxID=359407 RepID=UPI00036CD4A7|nr:MULTISPECIES: primosomal protein N' [Methylotenera]